MYSYSTFKFLIIWHFIYFFRKIRLNKHINQYIIRPIWGMSWERIKCQDVPRRENTGPVGGSMGRRETPGKPQGESCPEWDARRWVDFEPILRTNSTSKVELALGGEREYSGKSELHVWAEFRVCSLQHWAWKLETQTMGKKQRGPPLSQAVMRDSWDWDKATCQCWITGMWGREFAEGPLGSIHSESAISFLNKSPTPPHLSSTALLPLW